MSENETTSNGWDLIAAASQDGLNAQLAKIPAVVVEKDVSLTIVGSVFTVHVDITLQAPELRVKDGSGRQVDVLLPIQGTILWNNTPIHIKKGEKLIVTTQLTKIEGMLGTHKDPKKTDYDLIIDFESEDAIVDIKLDIPAGDLAFLVEVLKTVVQKHLKNGKEYTLASFSLPNEQVTVYQPLIPRIADFSFVQDPKTPGRSNLLVLMQSVSDDKGKIYFNKPLLATDQDFMVLISNKVFLQHFVMPPMIEHIKKEAKYPDDVSSQISTKLLTQPDLYQVYNNTDIKLAKEHDPWISTMTATIDTVAKALCLYLDVKADVTFLDFRVDTWDKSWQQFKVDKKQQKVTLEQVKEEKGKSTKVPWYEWLIAFISWIAVVVVAIMLAIVEKSVPDLGGTFVEQAPLVVQWPNQKHVTLNGMTTPNHVVLDLEVEFL